MTRSHESLWFILASMLATFVVQRGWLHLVNPNSDFNLLGYNVHHLFTGALIETIAAFALAVGIQNVWRRRACLSALGIGSAMVLDEIVYLIATDGSNQSYLLPVSLYGAIVMIAVAALYLVVLSRGSRGN
ncbi:MAG: hypothetical protein AB1752_10060 [Candidatus Zixiibacteriota bacterium]